VIDKGLTATYFEEKSIFIMAVLSPNLGGKPQENDEYLRQYGG
jgi:hypothetical protein